MRRPSQAKVTSRDVSTAPRFKGWVVPVVVVILGLTTSSITTVLVDRQIEDEKHHEVQILSDAAATAVQRRVASYSEVLHGLRGLYGASDGVTRAAFSDYVAIDDFASRYPGIRALEFTRLIATEDTGAFEDSVRTDTSLNRVGYLEFTVHPETTHGDRFVVDYVEPLEGNEAAFGFDLGTNPVRRISVEEARDTGLPVATSGIQLVQDQRKETGFLLLLAVYSDGAVPNTLAERRERFVGLVNGVFHVADLLDNVLGSNTGGDIEIYDSGPIGGLATLPSVETLLHDSDGTLNAIDTDAATESGMFTTVVVGGRRWTIYVQPEHPAGTTVSWLLKWVLLAGGLVVTLIAAALAQVLARSRNRALRLAQTMTVDLEQQAAQLRAARDDARAADRAKSEFLANVSHEIRTPLHGMLGTSQLMLDTDLTSEQRDYIEVGTASANSLLTLINGILDLAKIEAGKFALDVTPFDPRRLMDHLTWELGVLAREQGLELTHSMDPAIPSRLISDPTRLRQILVNLISNAIKFTEHGGVHVQIDVTDHTAAGVGLHFQVTDTGIGIAAEKVNSIFNSFEQADASVTKAYGGTGLGLSIVSQLVAMMGGEVWVESEEASGSTFHFTARMQVAPASEDHTSRPSGSSDLDLSVWVLARTDAVARKLERLATRSRWQLTLVDSFAAAGACLRRHEESPPRVIVIEEEVEPGEIESDIRHLRSLTTSLIVLLASPGEPGDAARAHGAGVGVYLAGPVTGMEIREAVAAAARPGGKWSDELITRHVLREQRRPLRVLLADDSATNRLIVNRALGAVGYEVLTASNGRLAVEAIVDGQFDVVLMDVHMPEMDGIVATEKIRPWETGMQTRIPIVALTANAMQGDEERFLAAGMDAYLSKPFDVDELIAELADADRPLAA